MLASWSLGGMEKMPASVDEDENKPSMSATGQIEKDYGARTDLQRLEVYCAV